MIDTVRASRSTVNSTSYLAKNSTNRPCRFSKFSNHLPRGRREKGRRAGLALRGKEGYRNANRNELSQGHSLLHGQDMGKTQNRRNSVEQWLAVGRWWLVAVGGWRLAVGGGGGGWRLVVVGGWQLVAVAVVGGWVAAVGGGWRLAVSGWRLVVGSGWRLAVGGGGGGWRLVVVGGWQLVAVAVVGGWVAAVGGGWRLAVSGWRLVVGGGWRLAVGGWWSLGAVLKGCPQPKKETRFLRTALAERATALYRERGGGGAAVGVPHPGTVHGHSSMGRWTVLGGRSRRTSGHRSPRDHKGVAV